MGAVPETDRSVNPRVLRRRCISRIHAIRSARLWDVARASTRARQSTANDTTEPPSQPRRSEGEVVLAARTEEIVRELDPWIRTRRAVVWGQPEPPCQSLDDAAGWIEREAATLPPLPNAEFDDALDAEIDALLERMLAANPWAYSYGITSRGCRFHYWRPDGSPASVPVNHRHLALSSVSACDEIVAVARLPRETVTAWFLNGIRPGQRVRLSGGRTVAMPGLRLVSSLSSGRGPRASRKSFPDPHAASGTGFPCEGREYAEPPHRVARSDEVLADRAPTLTAKQRRIMEIVGRLNGPPTPKYARSF